MAFSGHLGIGRFTHEHGYHHSRMFSSSVTAWGVKGISGLSAQNALRRLSSLGDRAAICLDPGRWEVTVVATSQYRSPSSVSGIRCTGENCDYLRAATLWDSAILSFSS